MANGLFNLKQVMQGIQQGGWQGAAPSTYSASFNTATLQYLTTVLSSALSGQFTVEFWYKRYSSGNTTLITIGDSSLSTGIEFYIGSSGANNTLYSNNTPQISSTAFPFGTWNHIAFTRDGSNVIRLFINGNVVGSTYTSSATFSSSVRIGVEYYASTVSAAGSASISNVRILNGTCLYTTNFAVPTSPLTNITNTALLTLQNATIVDNSSSALSITNTGTVATVVDSAMFSPNVKTPAVEYLVVAGGGGGGGCSSTTEAGGGGGAGGLLQGIDPVPNGQTLLVTVGAGGSALSGSTMPTNGSDSVFGNISATGGGYGGVSYLGSSQYSAGSGGSGGGGNGAASGQSLKAGRGVVNQGNAGGSGSSSSSAGGGGGAGTVGLPGYSTYDGNGGTGVSSAISGTATTYAGGGGSGGSNTITQSLGGVGGGGNGGTYGGTAATSGTANTGGGGGAGARDAGASGTGGSGIVIVSYPDVYAAPTATTGSPTVSTSGSGSVSFSGSSQYLVSATSSNFSLGSSDFSVECWVYKTSTSGNQVAVASSVTGNYDPIFFYFNNGSNNAVLYLSSTGSSFDIASAVSVGTVSLNTWTHLAVTRVNTTFTTYINGVQTSTFTSSASIYKSTNTYALGAAQTSINAFNGYISNVRVVKGSSAYSGAFTPSTTPLTPITNTVLLVSTVSGAPFADSSTTSTTFTATGSPAWNASSPFTVTGYKNRVYTWTSSGSITF